MKKHVNTFYLIGLIIAVSSLLSSCKKEAVQHPLSSPGLRQLTGGQVFFTTTGLGKQAFSVMNYMVQSRLSKKTNGDGAGIDFEGSCASVHYDTLPEGYRATLDFGTNGCYDHEGKHYTGKIVVEYNTDDLGMPGAQIHATFTNFTIDTFKINGTVSARNNGTNAAGNRHGEITGNVTLTLLTTGEVYNTTAFISVQDPGNEAQIDGSISLTEATSGHSLHINSIETVIHPYNNCDYPVSGKILKQETGEHDELTDFGAGTCDNVYSVTINGVTTNYNF